VSVAAAQKQRTLAVSDGQCIGKSPMKYDRKGGFAKAGCNTAEK
jgi:hypothetical protein